MDSVSDVPTIENALSRISQYAQEHELTPRDVCDYFSAGIVEAHVLGSAQDSSVAAINPVHV